VQVREDGAAIDQIVLSPTTYATSAPGASSNDTTIVPRPGAPAGPGFPSAPSPADGATGVSTAATLTWSATGATTYDVRFGTSNPPPQIISGTSTPSYAPALVQGTTYYWQIVAHNGQGSTTGPVWSFTTVAPPQPPSAPASPSPASGATGVSVTPTLTWTASGATGYDVRFGTSNPPPDVSTNQPAASYSPPALGSSTVYYWQVVARNDAGSTVGPVWSFTTAAAPPADIVIYAVDVPAGARFGSWTLTADATAADGFKLSTPDAGVAHLNNPLAAPVDYFEATFQPVAGTPYRLWLRLKSLNNQKSNDAVWVQFSDAQAGGAPVYPLNSTSGLLVNLATDATGNSLNGWGWQNGAYWRTQATTLTFPAGTQTLRVQVREDGVELDQIVLSPATYLNGAPGPATADATIVPKPAPPAPPTAPATPSPAHASAGVSVNPTLTWTSSGATSFDVSFGTANPPPPAATGLAGPSYAPATLAFATTSYWQVTARNSAGSTAGPVWSFTTNAPPPPPAVPASPTPANGATSIATTPTLSWTSPDAATFDVRLGTTNPPPEVAVAQVATSATPSYTPSALQSSTTYYWQVVSRNDSGSSTGPVWSFTTAAPPPSGNVVIYASDIPAEALHGAWASAADATSPNGVKLTTPDAGIAHTSAPLASPVHYVDVAFEADADRPYAIWLRLRAIGNSKWNDAVWVQFSDARAGGAPVYPIGTTSGLLVNLATDSSGSSLSNWGWQNGAYWMSQATTVTFASSGIHTMRIQVREDGVELDQIVLSPTTYLSVAPGSASNDTTFVPKE
jgi:hypothetical protein